MSDPTESFEGDGLLTLQEAADRLRVHYMTAYRWVRKGDLPAFKAGGRLRVRVADLDAFLDGREIDVVAPSSSPQGTDWQRHVERLYELLIDGQSVEAGALVRKVVADGAPVGDVYLHLLAPALHRVGEQWAAGQLSVPVEHRATEIAAAILARLGESFRRRGPRRGTAVTLTPPGDHHALAATMVADFLRADRFDVHHLGANVPVEDLGVFLEVVPCDVLCVSVSNPGVDPSVYAALVATARTAHPDVLVIFGGQAHDPTLAEAAGAISVADLTDLSTAIRTVERA